MTTRRKYKRPPPLPREEIEFREWAARRLRASLISIPFYQQHDKMGGMEFWRRYQGSQVGVRREEWEAMRTGPDVPLLTRTWRKCRYGLRDARKAVTAELAAWGSTLLDLRYPRDLRYNLACWRCVWQRHVANGRLPRFKTLGEPPMELLKRRIDAKRDT